MYILPEFGPPNGNAYCKKDVQRDSTGDKNSDRPLFILCKEENDDGETLSESRDEVEEQVGHESVCRRGASIHDSDDSSGLLGEVPI